MFRDGLTGQFYTAILEHEGGHWVVKGRKNQGIAWRDRPVPGEAGLGTSDPAPTDANPKPVRINGSRVGAG